MCTIFGNLKDWDSTVHAFLIKTNIYRLFHLRHVSDTFLLKCTVVIVELHVRKMNARKREKKSELLYLEVTCIKENKPKHKKRKLNVSLP